MPELPEVEVTRKTVAKALNGKRIAHAIADLDDHIVFDRATPLEIQNALEGRCVVAAGRKGKYFWLELDRKPWPVFHLGMTGHVELRKKSGEFRKAWGNRLWSETRRDKESGSLARFLPHCRLRFVTEDGTEFAFTDPRRFGRIRLANDPLREPPISELGYDPLFHFPTSKQLHEILKKRKAPIKAILLDQSVFAGVGNWIADEVLFQSGISPHRLGSKLSTQDVSRLRSKILSVVKKSVSLSANYERYPRTWLFHHRWGKGKDAQTSEREKITFDTVGGRTSAWVPKRQR